MGESGQLNMESGEKIKTGAAAVSDRRRPIKARKLTIRARLLIWFLMIALIPLAIALYLTYTTSRRALESVLHDYLMTFANAKAQALEAYAAERSRDVTALSRTQNVRGALTAFGDAIKSGGAGSAGYAAADQAFGPFLRLYTEQLDYDDVILISAAGDIVFSVKGRTGVNLHNASTQDPVLAGVFDRAETLMETEVSDFQTDSTSETPIAFIAAPVLQEGVVLGSVVLALNTGQITRIVNDYTGLGETGETLIGAIQGGEILFVTPLRHDPSAAFKRKIPIGGSSSLGMQRAVRGSKGFGRTVDYRGKQVIVVWRYLPSFRWGLVVKLDIAEAFARITRQRNAVLYSAAGVLILVVLIAGAVARSISQPITGLTRFARQVSAGDLRTRETGTAVPDSKDEVSILWSGFFKMTSNLVNLVRGVKGASEDVTASSSQIAGASKQLEVTVTEQAAATQEVVATSSEISSRSRVLVETVQEIARVAEETASLARSGENAVSEMEAAMHELVDAAVTISAKLSGLKEKAGNIGAVITVIARVADQTNLLSLNAAIEAEKAGDLGRGFSVVASEIRRLADQSALSAQDIERIISEMQSSVSAGVLSAEKFAREVRGRAEKVRGVSRQFTQIIEQVQTVTPRFETVNEGVQSQSISAEQIAEAMTYLNEAAHQTTQSVRELNRVVQQLNQAAQNLQEEVSRFTVS